MIESTFLRELMLIRQASQKSAIFVTRYNLNKGFNFQPNVCNGCHDSLMMSMNPSNIAILNIKSGDYLCVISGSSKIQAINLMQNFNLTEKSGTLKNIKIYYYIQKWVKKFYRLVILKLKKMNFAAIKVLLFQKI